MFFEILVLQQCSVCNVTNNAYFNVVIEINYVNGNYII